MIRPGSDLLSKFSLFFHDLTPSTLKLIRRARLILCGKQIFRLSRKTIRQLGSDGICIPRALFQSDFPSLDPGPRGEQAEVRLLNVVGHILKVPIQRQVGGKQLLGGTFDLGASGSIEQCPTQMQRWVNGCSSKCNCGPWGRERITPITAR